MFRFYLYSCCAVVSFSRNSPHPYFFLKIFLKILFFLQSIYKYQEQSFINSFAIFRDIGNCVEFYKHFTNDEIREILKNCFIQFSFPMLYGKSS